MEVVNFFESKQGKSKEFAAKREGLRPMSLS